MLGVIVVQGAPVEDKQGLLEAVRQVVRAEEAFY